MKEGVEETLDGFGSKSICIDPLIAPTSAGPALNMTSPPIDEIPPPSKHTRSCARNNVHLYNTYKYIYIYTSLPRTEESQPYIPTCARIMHA